MHFQQTFPPSLSSLVQCCNILEQDSGMVKQEAPRISLPNQKTTALLESARCNCFGSPESVHWLATSKGRLGGINCISFSEFQLLLQWQVSTLHLQQAISCAGVPRIVCKKLMGAKVGKKDPVSKYQGSVLLSLNATSYHRDADKERAEQPLLLHLSPLLKAPS